MHKNYNSDSINYRIASNRYKIRYTCLIDQFSFMIHFTFTTPEQI